LKRVLVFLGEESDLKEGTLYDLSCCEEITRWMSMLAIWIIEVKAESLCLKRRVSPRTSEEFLAFSAEQSELTPQAIHMIQLFEGTLFSARYHRELAKP